jgi:hypothetical protein
MALSLTSDQAAVQHTSVKQLLNGAFNRAPSGIGEKGTVAEGEVKAYIAYGRTYTSAGHTAKIL